MGSNKTFENFPFWMVAIADAVAFGIYIIGAYIMLKFGMIWGLLYIAFCAFTEIRIMRMSCIHCYYYGKWCGLGKGRISAIFFKKGDPKIFPSKSITWKDLIPDLLVALIPFIFGIYLLILGFNWVILFLIILIFALATLGNGFVRSNIVCKYCKQRELGCPAEKLFAKAK